MLTMMVSEIAPSGVETTPAMRASNFCTGGAMASA